MVALDLAPGTDRHGRLHHDRVVGRVAELLDHLVDAREVGVAGVGRRGVDAAEQQLGATEQLGHVGREVRRSAFLASSSVRPGSWIGTSPARERSDLLVDDVARVPRDGRARRSRRPYEPTQPTPITPIGSFLRSPGRRHEAGEPTACARSGRSRASASSRATAAACSRPSRRRLGAPCDQPQAVAVEEQLVLAPADRALLGLVAEDRRVLQVVPWRP